MGVDKQAFESRIDEIAGGNAELREALLKSIGGNEEAAAKFVGGFERTADYTKKSQQLADEKKKLDAVRQDMEQRLTAADAEKVKIMKDLANEKISASRATTLLQHVKSAYNLTDDDIPSLQDVAQTAKGGKVVDNSVDIEDRLKSYGEEVEKKIMDRIGKQLMPELSSLGRFSAVWSEIDHEHQRLFGKRMSLAEKDELMKGASEANTTLIGHWEGKFGVADKKMAMRDDDNQKKWRADWEKEQQDRASKAAIEGLRPNTTVNQDESSSPIFRKKFSAEPEPVKGQELPKPGDTKAAIQQGTPRLRGADAAAARFIERRNAGIGMGKPDPEKGKAA